MNKIQVRYVDFGVIVVNPFLAKQSADKLQILFLLYLFLFS